MNPTLLFEEQIKIQEKTIQIFKLLILVLLIVGISILLIATILFIKDRQIEIISIGGFFISALSTIPYKEIPPRKERIATYKYLIKNFEENQDASSSEQEMLMNITTDAIKETMKR